MVLTARLHRAPARLRCTGRWCDHHAVTLAHPVLIVAAVALTVAALASVSEGAVPYVPCHKPRRTATRTSPVAGAASAVQWAFRGSGGGSVTSGKGSYNGSRSITGSICHNDAPSQGSGQRLALAAIPGSSARLSRGVTINGTLGAQLVLPVRVSASDDARCLPGARGTVTIFTSYNGVHEDSISLRLSGPCARHGASYRGANVVVSIPH
jgi:hypothetical protein